ncbi:Dehydrogenase/reductase SDR family protein 7-like [Gryllus bimaculatus]|nr:Dehydrogenase/reductase SDR family protein 7-like [Gryllus bimaculatus]
MGPWAAAVGELLLSQWTLGVLVFAVVFKVWYKTTQGACTSRRRLDGLTALVTGANSGIGLETAKDLARRGARVLMACRDPQRGQNALEAVRAEATGGASVELLSLDLSSLQSVRACAAKVLALEPRLHILINNAGAVNVAHAPTKDGLHDTLQVNFLGPFLLTVLLVELLQRSAPARVVFVSSSYHRFARLTPDLLDYPRARELHAVQVYCLSKLAVVIVANELSRRLKGTGVTVNSLHPGAVNTAIFRHFPPWISLFFNAFLRIFMKNAVEGAQTTIHVAVCEEVEGVTGRYFSDCTESWLRSQALDEKLAQEVWEKSEKLVRLRDYERPSFHS